MDSESSIKRASPPSGLPILTDQNDWKSISFFGRTNYATGFSERHDFFGIKRFDRRRHLYIVGKTGVGKTKMIELLARADIDEGYGLCVIDPHGDLIGALLDYIPREYNEDVVLIDPTDVDFPVSFNPFYEVPTEDRHLVTSGLIEAFKKQFGEQWTSRLEHVCRFTILALLEYKEATFADMTKMLTDAKFRQKVIPNITDDVIRRFWTLEFAAWSERFDNEAITPLVNRIGQFLSNPLIRHTFSQRDNKINFDHLINSSSIILINLSKGVLGEENTELFGSLIITAIYQAAMRRAKILEIERTPFYLYVDEFQNVATQTFLNFFSESRKYGINITVSHQYLGQITPKMRDTIFGNAGTLVSFSLGAEDAERMAKEFMPVCRIDDLLNLKAREFVVKLLIDGKSTDPFSGETMEVEDKKESYKEEIIEFSRSKYSHPIKEVKQELLGGDLASEESEYEAPLV